MHEPSVSHKPSYTSIYKEPKFCTNAQVPQEQIQQHFYTVLDVDQAVLQEQVQEHF